MEVDKNNQDTPAQKREERRKVLVVSKEDLLSTEMTRYAVSLAERLGYDLIVLSVESGTGAVSSLAYEHQLRRVFQKRSVRAVRPLMAAASRKGVQCEHIVKFGDVATAVDEVYHSVRRIELVLVDWDTEREGIAGELPLPIFSIQSKSRSKGEFIMSHDQHHSQKKRPLMQTVGYGLLTTALYAAVFTNADAIAHYFARGGWYSALPIATVFAFSFAHGTFASHLWSLLGVEAVKKDALRKMEQQVVQQKKTLQKRPRAHAYVNPFHRI